MRNLPVWILFACAFAMAYLGTVRYRAGQRGRAMYNFFMAASMIVFGLVYLGAISPSE
ncbi:MAG: hypothetical protein LBS00_05710 [Synergistaceae bacterium]|jgi:hypothetical protein|nr:hypothetical protein [Synergistaceae bacterium]